MGSICIGFLGAHTKDGYAERRIDGKVTLLHRWTWEQAHGPIPKGMVIMHTCDNPGCIRLDHLRLGTQAENLADMAAKGRARNAPMLRDHCKHGHPYTPENTYHPPKRPTHRHCRACQRGGQ